MMRNPLLIAFFLFLAATPAVGQSYFVSPSTYATQWGGGGNCFPYGMTSPYWRYQQIHSDLPSSVGIILGMAWRRQNTTNTHPATTYNMRFLLSTAATPPTSASTVFSANHGSDLVSVFYGSGGPGSYQAVNWPATNPPTSGVAPFEYKITFNRPFIYKKKALCWEVRIKGIQRSTTTNFYIDYTGRANSPYVSRIKWTGTSLVPGLQADYLPIAGAACTASDQSAIAVMTQSNTLTSGTWTINLGGAALKKNSTALYIMGNSTTSWGAIPLPFLFPGSSTCGVYTQPIILGPGGATDGTGAITAAPLQLADSPALTGLTIHTHWLCLDQGRPLGVISSRGFSLTWPGPGGGILPDTAQGVWNGQGLITRFEVR